MSETDAPPRDEATGQFVPSTEGLTGRELANAEAGFTTKKDDPPADEKTYSDTLDGVKEAARDLADTLRPTPTTASSLTASGRSRTTKLPSSWLLLNYLSVKPYILDLVPAI